MPIIEFTDIGANLFISKHMLTPKRVSSTDAWMQQARKTIPEIPTSGTIGCLSITHEWIYYEIEKADKSRAYVLIRRGSF